MIFHSAPGRAPDADRGLSEHKLDRLLAWGRRLPRHRAAALAILALALAGLGDWATGTQAWFGPIYLVVIAAGAWTLGTRAGVAIGLGCMATSIAANGVHLYPFGAALVAWNYAMRTVAVITIVALIGSIRRAHDREWLQARRDRLTGLLNREGFFESLARRPEDSRWSLLVYLDLDDFKQVNDGHGHAAGDALLRDFAGAVQTHVGPAGRFARIGGDEFLLLLPVAGEAEAAETARRLHGWINGAGGRAGPVRCSVGALVRGPGCGQIGERDMQRADRLMYAGKSDGSGLRIGTHESRCSLARPDEGPRALAA
jgi:diguanylate cyclase (GGDEF)-like protein